MSRHPRRVVGAGLLLLACAALASTLLDAPPAPPPRFVTAAGELTDHAGAGQAATLRPQRRVRPGGSVPAAEPCTPTPPLRFDGSPVPDPATLRFNSNDGVRLRVCGPGTLTLRAEGTAVDGVGARLLVALDTDTLWDATVTGPRMCASPCRARGGWWWPSRTTATRHRRTATWSCATWRCAT